MKFTLENNDRYSISRYEQGVITVGNRCFDSSIVIHSTGKIERWPVSNIEIMSYEDLSQALIEDLEVLILGTGARQVFPNMQYGAKLSQLGIGFEVMDTTAACRTYNILLSEDRNVSAALVLGE